MPLNIIIVTLLSLISLNEMPLIHVFVVVIYIFFLRQVK